MAQTIENFGGPGTARSKYVRALLSAPHMVHPMAPLLGGGMGFVAQPRMGLYSDDDMQQGQSDQAMSAFEASLPKTAARQFATEMGRTLARIKIANDFSYEAPPPPMQYVRAAMPSQAEQAQGSLRAAAGHFGAGLGETALAAGHGLRAASGAIGRKVHGALRGVGDFMMQEGPSEQRWGVGTPPAAMTNEYGQPIY